MPDEPAASPDIAIFLRNLAGGGIERVMLHLAEEFVARGLRVDLVVGERRGARVDEVPPTVRLLELGRSNLLRARLAAARADPAGLAVVAAPILLARKPPPTLAFLPNLVRYLRANRPRSLLAATAFENLEAVRARRLAGVPTRLVLTEHSNLSQNLLASKEWARRYLPALVARGYPEAEAVVAVSHGAADQLAAATGLPRSSIATIYNPVITRALLEQAAAPVDDPWLAPGEPPVVMGAGRLAKVKDFPTLVRAFAIARRTRPMRLLIAGGADSPSATAKRQQELIELGAELGVADDLKLPGHLKNPMAAMARAGVFVLSSRFEGLGNVLIEAMACGTPVVATDCPSGPAEILDHGRYGRLVPVGDPTALAEAILATLADPPPAARLRARAGMFTVERAAQAYLELLLPELASRRCP